jgi:hypothetical protein
VLSKFAGAEVNLEDAKAQTPRLMIVFRHEGKNQLSGSVAPLRKLTKAGGENPLSPVASVLYPGT